MSDTTERTNHSRISASLTLMVEAMIGFDSVALLRCCSSARTIPGSPSAEVSARPSCRSCMLFGSTIREKLRLSLCYVRSSLVISAVAALFGLVGCSVA